MGDEAFARRFYADRSELQGLGVPIASVRDEFTSEELYSLREEHYFLPSVELTDSELAALQMSFYLLEGQFAYAEPLRLALQNLALGRAWPAADPGPKTATVELLGPSYTSEVAQRLAKLEQAISRQRTVRFRYWTIDDRLRGRAHGEPVRAVRAERCLVRGRRRPRPPGRPRPPAHVPRLADPGRDQVRHPPRARLPHAGRLQRHRLPRPRAVAARPRGGRHRHPDGRRRRELAGRAPLRRLRRVRGAGRRVGPLHDRILRGRAALGVDPVAGRPGRARRAGRARRRRRRPTCRRWPTRTRRRRARSRPGRRSGRAGRADARSRAARAPSRPSASRSCRPCSRSCSRAAARAPRPASRPPSSRSASSSAPQELQGEPRAPEPGQLRRRLLRGLLRHRRRRRHRRQGALRRRVPPAGAALAARGQGAPARARRRRAAGRRRGRHVAADRPREGRGGVRALPARRHADAAGGGREPSRR